MSVVETVIARSERGIMRKLPPSVVMLAHASAHRCLGEPELRELPRLVRPGTVAVDVGAHFGVYTYHLARLVGKTGLVIAVEPIEEDATLIERAAASLRLPIRVEHCAASSREGDAILRVPRLGGAQKTALSTLEQAPQTGEVDLSDERVVRARTIDSILSDELRPIGMIKIDVEGHELGVIEGAARTLAEQRPNLLIEINHDLGARSIETVFRRILDFGYQGEFLEEGRYRRSISEFRVEMHQLISDGNVLSKRYVNNFVFLPDSSCRSAK